ncbi:MAG: hypothetical protein HKO54_06540 [Flavobacteriaceae bacterium]|nr:hypothetical protein [Flavobacteriaceae bacterium]
MEEQIEHKNWFGRNWKWVVPTGGCLLVIIVIILFVGSIFWGVTSMFSESAPYQEAMSRVQANEQVIQQLGEPIEQHGMSSGNINISNGRKSANLNIPIEGPKGEATITVIATGRGDDWTYQTMTVEFADTGEYLNLLETDELLDK